MGIVAWNGIMASGIMSINFWVIVYPARTLTFQAITLKIMASIPIQISIQFQIPMASKKRGDLHCVIQTKCYAIYQQHCNH